MSVPTVTWLDLSFGVYDGIPGTAWNDVPGIYIFARLDADGWRAVYIGETNSLANRLPGHERGLEALLAGATHVHARVERDEPTRVARQDRLIETFQPELNDQGR
ncbi:MAG: hypothetical protein OXF93_15320 [Acidobacteria bacterium]|nr:hypothetical protein [Acidobacteriota bacterium]